MSKKYPLKYYLLFLVTFPVDIFIWLFVFCVWLFWGTKLDWHQGLWCELKPFSWPAKTWYRIKQKGKFILIPEEHQAVFGKWRTWSGTCLGHGGFYGPGISGGKGVDTLVEYHEHIHLEQYEVSLLTGFLQMLLVIFVFVLMDGWICVGVICLTLWLFSFLLQVVSGWLVAWLRGGDAYRDSMHEKSAYALEKDFFATKIVEYYLDKQHGSDN